MTTATLLAEYAVAAREPDDVLGHGAARAFLDTLASAAAGWTETSSVLARNWAATAAGSPDAPLASEWSTGTRVLASEAAFANGIAAHAVDLDDVSMSMWGHPSTLLVPVALAAAEATGASIWEALDAYLVGLQTDLAVAAGFDLVDHYARGWHASVTIGTIGAVATVSRLLGLDAQQTAHAIGIGVSMASGSRQNFGTTTKALHIGFAASNAIRAAQLAGAGAEASGDALEGPLGFFELYGADKRAEAVAEALGKPEGEALASLNTKRYPCCYQTHRAVDATLDLQQRLGPTTEADVSEVVVHVNPGSDNSLIHPYATTPTEARFCMRFVVAAALLRGRIDLQTFTESEVGARDIQTLMRRVRLEHDDTPPYEPMSYSQDYAAVGVHLASGQSENRTCVAPRGNSERPLSDAQLLAKVQSCLTSAGDHDPGKTAAAMAEVLASPEGPAARLTQLISSVRGRHSLPTVMKEGPA